MKFTKAVLASALLSIGLVITTPASAVSYYSGIDLGTLLGGTWSTANGINASGQVVGTAGTAVATRHAFITGANGVGMTDLGTMGGNYSTATGINASGQMVGTRTIVGDQAYITGANGVSVTSLGTLGGAQSSGYGINDSGQVVGSAQLVGNATSHAYITGANGVGMTDIGTLGGLYSLGYGINASGQVVGYSDLAGSPKVTHAFVTGANGVGMTDIGTLGGKDSYAYGINASGQAVGNSLLAGNATIHAFITGANGVGITDLNDLVKWESPFGGPSYDYFTNANGINDLGQVIVGSSSGHAYLLTPASAPGVIIGRAAIVPVPAAGWLLGSGLVGMLSFARKRDDQLVTRDGQQAWASFAV